jgi:hypothetical protein
MKYEAVCVAVTLVAGGGLGAAAAMCEPELEFEGVGCGVEWWLCFQQPKEASASAVSGLLCLRTVGRGFWTSD